MRRFYILFFFSFLSLLSFAQQFKGTVSNENGEPVPFASFYFREISYGFITDDTGHFQATIKAGTYTCEISSLGYIREIINIRIPVEGLTKNIILKERIYELSEVSITKDAEDPAYSVMRKAVAYAPKYRTYVKNYTADTYLKGTGKLSSIPAILKLSKEVREESKNLMDRTFLLEEQRSVKYTAPSTWENEIHAYTNSFPENIRISLEITDINLYQPKLFGKISPLSPGSFSYYNFKLDGCFAEGDYLINKIKIIPKKNSPELMSGHLYIVEDLWCIYNADLNINDRGITANVQVTCKEVKPSVFLSASIGVTCTIDILGVKAEASYLSAIQYIDVIVDDSPVYAREDNSEKDISPARQPLGKEQGKIMDKIEELRAKENFTTRDAYRMSKLISKSTQMADTTKREHKFERKSRIYQAQTDSLAGERDSAYWAKVRTVPLRPEEMESYAYKEKLLHKKDSLGKDTVKNIPRTVLTTLLFGGTFDSKDKNKWIRFYDLSLYAPEYNFVDGLWVGAKINTGIHFNKQTTLQFTPQLYYAFSRKKWIGKGELLLNYAPRNLGKLLLEGGTQTADFNGETGESRLINAFSSILFARNGIKLYERNYITIRNEVELINSLKLITGFSMEERNTLMNSVNKSIFGKTAEANIPDNPEYTAVPRNNLLQADISLEYTPEHYYRMFRGRKYYENSRYPTLLVQYKRAFSHGGKNKATPSSHRLEISLNQNIEFGFLNNLNWYVNAGTFPDKNDLFFADFKHFTATKLLVTEYSFERNFSLPDNYKYSTDSRWVQAHITWSTPYLLIKHLPFLQDKYFDEALHLRGLWVDDRKPYAELGYSIGFASLGRLGVFAGFEKWRYQSVGVSLSFPLLRFTGR